MEKEKIRKIYQKFGGNISDEALQTILKDKERKNALMRIYKEEEINSMNYILGKPKGNSWFTKAELEEMSMINFVVIIVMMKIYIVFNSVTMLILN